jgi:hypothetical protein
MKYLVTGLPRSRTLWMSKFLPNCMHEVAHDLDSLDELDRIDTDGISDSGLGFHLAWILENLKVPVLIINRDIKDVEQSILDLNLGYPASNICDVLLEKLTAQKNHPLVLWVDFDEIDTRMQEICAHLKVHYIEEKHQQMRVIEMQLDSEAIKAKLKLPHHVGKLLLSEVVPLLKLKETDHA